MIGVLATNEARPVVQEFFELFKTPWEFYRKGAAYDVLLCDGVEVPDAAASLVMIYGARPNPFDCAHGIKVQAQPATALLHGPEGRLAIYGPWASIDFSGRGLLRHPDRETAVGVVLRHGHQTLVRIGFDLFHEIQHLLVKGQPAVHARIPTLERHIALLRDQILRCGLPLVEIPPVPAGFNFIACLTHDVDHYGVRNHRFDHTMWGFVYRAAATSVLRCWRGEITPRQLLANWAAVGRLPLVQLGWAGDFWCQLDRYLEIEQGMGSSFYFIPFRNRRGRSCNGRDVSRRAARYDVAELREELRRLERAGCEIGLHGIDAWCDAGAGQAERERLAEGVNSQLEGVRMHWLFFDDQSPATLEAAGFSYDSSFGYNECVGFRAGTAQAFLSPGVTQLLELPLILMDTALFYPHYLNLSAAAAEQVVAELLREARQFGGAVTINWHDRSILPERHWDGFYRRLLRRLRDEQAWMPTAANAVAWFRKRRSARIEEVVWRNGTVRVRASVAADAGKLPALRLRLHAPATPAVSSEARFVDFTLDGTLEETMDLPDRTPVPQLN